MTAAPDTLRRCRVCGCTDTYACEGGCHWVGADLCSECGFGGPAAAAGHGPDDAFDPDLDGSFDPRAGDFL
jgi:hypothetical protein